MKAVIITEGGKNIGFGHVTRCLSLGSELEKKNVEVYFIINDGSNVIEKFKGEKIKTYKSGRFKITRKILVLFKSSDCAIIDSYKFKKCIYDRIQREVKLLISIDDNKRINYPPGIVVNGAVYAKNLNYPVSKNITYLLGTKFMPICQTFIRAEGINIKEDISSILITFGGSDFKQMTSKIRDFILSRFPEMKLDIVIGEDFRNKRIFKNDKDKRICYHYNVAGRGMVKLMQSADVAISAGGQTLYEIARIGIPTIGICMADNQLNNLKGWVKQGFLKYCGWYNDPLLFNKIYAALIEMQSITIREKMKRTGQRLVDAKGAERIVNRILEIIKCSKYV